MNLIYLGSYLFFSKTSFLYKFGKSRLLYTFPIAYKNKISNLTHTKTSKNYMRWMDNEEK